MKDPDTNLEAILARIRRGESVSGRQLLPLLSLERPEARANVNALLAAAYFESQRQEQTELARTFIERAWLLSNFSLELLPLYVDIHAALGDVPAIKSAYKRVGMKMAARGALSEALKYFDLWQWAYPTFENADRYEYDFDILECLDRLAAAYRFSAKSRPQIPGAEKVRIAYLLKGIAEVGSVLMKVSYLLAKYHDRSRFDLTFFVSESERTVRESPEGLSHIRAFAELGYEIIAAPDVVSTKERLLAVGRAIETVKPDILITSAGLATLEHYFISSMRPAPIIIGLLQGPPPQFVAPLFDWAIAWSGHTLLDCPIGCSRSRMGDDLRTRPKIQACERRELRLPPEAVVIASAGRHVKFQDRQFWRLIGQILLDAPEVVYLAIGVREQQLPLLAEVVPIELQSRIRFIEWRGNDYLNVLALADLLIDTYPSGGGGILLDALALGIPCVSFENNYLRLFDQTDWSPADELIVMPELLVPRGDFKRMKEVVSRLTQDTSYRKEVATKQHQYIVETFGNPEASVRHCESIYLRVINDKASGVTASDAGALEYGRLQAQTRIKRGAFSWTAYQLKKGLYLGERLIDRAAERFSR